LFIFNFSLAQYIEVFKSISISCSISSHLCSDFLVHLHPDQADCHQKNCSNISHRSTSTHHQNHHQNQAHADQEVEPNLSYCCFLELSDKTWYASFISLNLFSESLSQAFLSG